MASALGNYATGSALGSTGPMAAYEIGDSTNSGCAPTPTPTPVATATPTPAATPTSGAGPADPNNPTSKNPSDKKSDDIWTGGGSSHATLPITFNLTSPLDPLGILFIYIWNFGDGSVVLNGPYGLYNYTYSCGGFYKVSASIVESNNRVSTFLRHLTVGFPSSVLKSYKGTGVSPLLSYQAADKVKVSLRVDKIGSVNPRAKVQRVDYKVDKKAYNKKSQKGVSAKVTPNRNHSLSIKVYLAQKKAKKTVTINTCFYL